MTCERCGKQCDREITKREVEATTGIPYEKFILSTQNICGTCAIAEIDFAKYELLSRTYKT